MHTLLPFYSLFSLMALLGLSLRTREERSMVWLAAWGGMLVMMAGVVFRDVAGDTARYYAAFESMSHKPFEEILSEGGSVLYNVLNWITAQWGDSHFWMILPTTLICVLMLRRSLHQMLGPGNTAIAILLYSVYPFFIFYVASGMKQALAMALLMQGYVSLWHKRWLTGVIWTAGAILFHNGAVLALPFLVLHLIVWQPIFGYRRALTLSISLLFLSTILAITNVNGSLLSSVQSYLVVADRYEIYFEEASKFNYRAGFRLDFTLLTFLPLLIAWWLHQQGAGLNLMKSGWWLNLYTLLACIYQLFAFAPFADRFAAFAWYILPAVVVVMIADTGARRPMQLLVITFAFANIVILQFYTGQKLHVSF